MLVNLAPLHMPVSSLCDELLGRANYPNMQRRLFDGIPRHITRAKSVRPLRKQSFRLGFRCARLANANTHIRRSSQRIPKCCNLIRVRVRDTLNILFAALN